MLPTDRQPPAVLGTAPQSNRRRLPPSRTVLPHSECVSRPYSAAPRIAAIPAHLRTYHPVSFRWALCNAPSTRKPGNLSKLTRTYAGMVAEEAREVSRLGKAELVADVADARRLIEHRIDRLLHANDVQVDLRRHPDRGFEQSAEMRARQSCL